MSEAILSGVAVVAALAGAIWLILHNHADAPSWVCRTCGVDFTSERDGILHCQLMHPAEFAEQQRPGSAGSL